MNFTLFEAKPKVRPAASTELENWVPYQIIHQILLAKQFAKKLTHYLAKKFNKVYWPRYLRSKVGNQISWLIWQLRRAFPVQKCSHVLFYNSGTIGLRKLKFRIWVGIQVSVIDLQLRRAWDSLIVLLHPFSLTLELFIEKNWNSGFIGNEQDFLS